MNLSTHNELQHEINLRLAVIDRVLKYFDTREPNWGYDYDNEKCEFLTSTGWKCAVGLFIPDHLFMNGEISNTSSIAQVIKAAKFEIESVDFWTTIQIIHDDAACCNAQGQDFEDSKSQFRNGLQDLRTKIKNCSDFLHLKAICRRQV